MMLWYCAMHCLEENELLFHQRPLHPDDQLALDWRKGHPYKILLSRRSYEREYRLQVELSNYKRGSKRLVRRS